MTKRTRLALALAAMIPALAAAPRAHADDQKLYIGALCQENALGETGAFFRNEAFITRTLSTGNGRLNLPDHDRQRRRRPDQHHRDRHEPERRHHLLGLGAQRQR